MKEVTPYRMSPLGKKAQVLEMFNTISSEYDRLNRVISFGMDVNWRKKLILMASRENPKQILDVATGTGDLAILLSSIQPQKITGIDISPKMITVGEAKVKKHHLTDKIRLVVGDSEDLHFKDNTFDLITIAFGVRNFENTKKGLSEILRVLKPKGRLLILETSVPKNPIYRLGYKVYSKLVLPFIGYILSKDKSAYSYLSKSASNFPYGKTFNNILSNVGFKNVSNHPQTMGVTSIYSAYK